MALAGAVAFVFSASVAPASAQVPVRGVRKTPEPKAAPKKPRGTLFYGAGLKLELGNPNLRENGWNEVRALIYSRLFHVGLDGTIQGDLVERHEISSDGLTWTLHLHHKVMWHDGNPFSSLDVQSTLDEIFDPNTPTDLDLNLPMVESFDYPDEYTVVIRLKYPAPMLPVPLSEIAILRGPGLFKAEKFIHSGTGPYRYSNVTNAGDYRFVRAERYHGDAATIDVIVLKEYQDGAARARALIKGDVDVAHIPSKHMAMLVGRPDLRAIRMKTGAWRGMPLNLKRPNLQDRRVRQAIDFSLDRDMIAFQTLPRLGTAAFQPVPPASWAFSEEMNESYRSTVKAGQLLDEAGWVLGKDGLRRKEGVSDPLGIKLIIWKDEPFRRKAGEMIQAQLKEVGIQVELELVDNQTYARLADDMGQDYDGFIGGWGSLLDPGDNIFKKFHSRGSQNYSGLKSESIDKLIEECRRTVDPEVAAPMFARLMKQLREEAVFLPLAYPDYLYGIGGRVSGIRPSTVDSWYEFPRHAASWRLVE
jgi:peptide/nickel transport system substrate-binding protein